MKLLHRLVVQTDNAVQLTFHDVNFKCREVLNLRRNIIVSFREVEFVYRLVVPTDGDVQLTIRDVGSKYCEII